MGPGNSADVGDLFARVKGFCALHVPRDGRLCVALSGGMDSVVLLDLVCRAARECDSFGVQAVHVDHGISPNSASWVRFCKHLCRGLDIPLTVGRAELDPCGSGLEARARAARREAFGRLDADCVALAHHLDDQIETFVFRVFRGSGLGGLGCMAPRSRLSVDSPIVLLRPLLGLERAVLRDHAQRNDLAWCEDETNCDNRISRNLIRNRALPLLEGQFPGYRGALRTALREIGEKGRLLDELADIDHRLAMDGEGWARGHFRKVGAKRTANWLHRLIASNGLAPRTWRQVAETARQICLPLERGRGLELNLGRHALAAHGDGLYLITSIPSEGAPDLSVDLRFEEGLQYENPFGRLSFERDDRCGLSERDLRSGRVQLRLRRGGERISQGRSRPRLQLKELFREAGIPPWVRDTIPLVYVDGELAAVPNLRVDGKRRAASGKGYFPRWDSRLTVPASALSAPSPP